MKKLYAFLFFTLFCEIVNAQCPTIRGAFVNACAVGGNDEGLNELIVFTTTTSAPVSNYVLSYGAANPPVGGTPAAAGVLSGANARTANGTGSITSALGCNITYVTSPSTVIPAASLVVFIPSNFTNNFDVSSLCQSGSTSYVVLIDVSAAPSKWLEAGVLVNNPGTGVNRYIQIESGADECAASVRSYTSGWGSNADGNFVAWDNTGTPTYSNLGCNLITLPVKLYSFNAVGTGKNATITWQTASEVNTRSFELQRATDGSNFSTVYTTAAAGHSSSVKNYAFTDLNIAEGPSYYRLKMIDIDGTLTYSKVAKVVSTRNGFVITNTYPSPATGQLGISWNSESAGSTAANVYDFTGRALISTKLSTASGMNYYQLPVSQLPAGTYLLKLVKDGETVVTKFSKQ